MKAQMLEKMLSEQRRENEKAYNRGVKDALKEVRQQAKANAAFQYDDELKNILQSIHDDFFGEEEK